MGNVIGDLFYPDNPKRRATVLKLTQKIADYMKENFRATNHLTNFLKENNVDGAANFTPITVDEGQTLKYNSQVLQNRIIEVQAIIEKIDKTLAEKLDPALYRDLKNVDLSFQDRLETAKKATTIVTGVVIAAATIAVCVAIASGGILAPVVAVLGAFATSAIASATIAVLGGLVLGAIEGAITGAIERDKLEDAIRSLETEISKFGPASEKYTDAIYEVLAELKIAELV